MRLEVRRFVRVECNPCVAGDPLYAGEDLTRQLFVHVTLAQFRTVGVVVLIQPLFVPFSNESHWLTRPFQQAVLWWQCCWRCCSWDWGCGWCSLSPPARPGGPLPGGPRRCGVVGRLGCHHGGGEIVYWSGSSCRPGGPPVWIWLGSPRSLGSAWRSWWGVWSVGRGESSVGG